MLASAGVLHPNAKSLHQAGNWPLRLMALMFVVVAWWYLDPGYTLPYFSQPETEFLLWTAICALAMWSFSGSPLMGGAAVLLWSTPMYALASVLLPGSGLPAIVGIADIILALACSYLVLLEPAGARRRQEHCTPQNRGRHRPLAAACPRGNGGQVCGGWYRSRQNRSRKRQRSDSHSHLADTPTAPHCLRDHGGGKLHLARLVTVGGARRGGRGRAPRCRHLAGRPRPPFVGAPERLERRLCGATDALRLHPSVAAGQHSYRRSQPADRCLCALAGRQWAALQQLPGHNLAAGSRLCLCRHHHRRPPGTGDRGPAGLSNAVRCRRICRAEYDVY